MTEYEKMCKGLIYDTQDPDIGKEQTRTHALCDEYNKLSVNDGERKSEILKELFGDEDFGLYRVMENPMFIENANAVTIGKNFFSNAFFCIVSGCTVEIGDNVFIGPNCTMATGIHSLVAEERRMKVDGDGNFHDFEFGRPIKVGNDVWIASNVTICAGVTIGDGAVIGAGSVVTKDIPAGTLAFGNPCTVQRKITSEDSIYNRVNKKPMK